MLKFTRFSDHQPGIIVSLLTQSYAAFFEVRPDCRAEWLPGWKQYDSAVFENPDTVGACGFVSCVEDQPVGFASWDPREFPTAGKIGHNCVVPAFRGRGLGRQQVTEILRQFRVSNVITAQVTTGAHPFFLPAQRMYMACGFREVCRRTMAVRKSYEVIGYELMLVGS